MIHVRTYLLNVANFEEDLWAIRIKMASELDEAYDKEAHVKYPDQFSMAEKLFEQVYEAEKSANKLWKSLRVEDVK